MKIIISLVIGAGCKECTRREIEYCLSNDVIEDHCCCQRKYHGMLYIYIFKSFIDSHVDYSKISILQKFFLTLHTLVM